MVITFLTYSYTLVTAVLLWFFLRKSFRFKKTLAKNITWWILFGFIFNLGSFSLIYTTYPLPWINGGVVQITGMICLHLLLSCISAICFCVVGYTFILHTQKHTKPCIFGISLAFAEILRSFFISLLFFGENGKMGLHFNTGTIGNALASTPFIEYAYFGGTFALTFIFGYFIYTVSSKECLRTYKSHIILLCAILVGIHFFIPTHGLKTPVTVGVITTDFRTSTEGKTLNEFREQSMHVHELTMSLADKNPSVIVYPEDTRYLANLTETSRYKLKEIFPNTLFIDGDTTKNSKGLSNVSLFYDTAKEEFLGRGKSLLLPFNEYIPYFFKPIFYFFIDKDMVDTYTKNHTYTPIHSKKTILFENWHITTLICSEILSYTGLHDLQKENPDIVFFQSQLAVFHDNVFFRMHMLSFVTVAAAQMRRPLISSANGAPSYIISPYGKVLISTPRGFSASSYVINASDNLEIK